MRVKKIFSKPVAFVPLFCFFLAIAWQVPLQAQGTQGTISGVVKDVTGGVMPGVEVTVTNVETGIDRSTITNDLGGYQAVNLAVGEYELRAELPGFQTTIRRGITLTVGRHAVVDLVLEVGEVVQEIIVTGEAALVETTSSTLEGLIDDKKLRDLPLNARSFIDLVTLTTGTTFSAGATSATKGFGQKISISGQRYNNNAFLLDGAVINDATGTTGSAAGLMMGVDTVREFSVITSGYSSEYGRHTGGVINAVTKSGTNSFHGSAFEYLRNDNLDARNFFDRDPSNPTVRSDPPEFKRNQFGFTLGGPIVKDQSFFFGSYEGLRERLGITQNLDVPGRAMRDGFLGGEFIGVDPVIRPFLDAYPLPTGPDRKDGTARFVRTATETTDEDYLTVKVDHRFSESDSLFVRYTFDDAKKLRPGGIRRRPRINTSADADTRNQYTTIEESHVFSPALVNRSQFSFNRTVLLFFDNPLEGFPFPSTQGGEISFSDQADVVGIINVGDLSTWGGGSTNPKEHIQNNFQFKEDLYVTRGNHSLKFGFQGERLHFNQRSDFNASGVFSFEGPEEFLSNDPRTFTGIRPGSDNRRGWRQWLIGFYAQDDFKITPTLTLNFGLRYEFIKVPTEVNDKVANIRDLSPAHFFTVDRLGTDVGDPYFDNPSLTNFAPRIGFAWDPFGNGKTAIRGGAGVFHDQLLPGFYITSGVRMEPFFGGAQLDRKNVDIDFPNAFFTQSDILTQGGGRVRIEGFEFDINQPTVYKWSLDIQQEILPDTLLDVGYVGTRGVHLVRGAIQLNTNPWEVRNGRFFYLIEKDLLNPNFDRMRWRVIDGTSNYHSFRLSVNKRFSRGFQIQSSLTIAKSTDDSSTWTGSSDFSAADRRGFRSFKFHGPSAFDVRRNFYTNFTWELPAANWSGAAGKIFGDWSMSSLIRFNDGHPVNLRGDQVRLGRKRLIYVDGSTLNLVPGADNSPIDSRNPNQYYDFGSFSFPKLVDNDGNSVSIKDKKCPASPCGLFEGTLGKNTLRAPGVTTFDFSLMKDFAIPQWGEGAKVQFRAEFFNIFNRANFGLPGERLFDRRGKIRSTAGEITTTETTSRQIQFALRLEF
ncbi:TonB-dependent receptor [Acidobacteria bacterium AH-259-D05]|nr:TonB-dependent receptor [Acidobacteria bacterium AH-259-D05]